MGEEAKITVYFLRHAESIWNDATDVFGRLRPSTNLPTFAGAAQLATELFNGGAKTISGLATGELKDAPLSEKGIEQSRALVRIGCKPGVLLVDQPSRLTHAF